MQALARIGLWETYRIRQFSIDHSLITKFYFRWRSETNSIPFPIEEIIPTIKGMVRIMRVRGDGEPFLSISIEEGVDHHICLNWLESNFRGGVEVRARSFRGSQGGGSQRVAPPSLEDILSKDVRMGRRLMKLRGRGGLYCIPGEGTSVSFWLLRPTFFITLVDMEPMHSPISLEEVQELRAFLMFLFGDFLFTDGYPVRVAWAHAMLDWLFRSLHKIEARE
ncbi:hypothetical protein AMTR_s00739p00009270, partial [Amborella trichopoda]